MKSSNRLKVVLFDTVIESLFDRMIENDDHKETLKLINRLARVAKENGYDRKTLSITCAVGLRNLVADLKADEDPDRPPKQAQIARMNMRFLTVYYLLTQIRPRSLKRNEEWAYELAQVAEKDRPFIRQLTMGLSLRMLSDREARRSFKGEDLKRIRQWRMALRA